MNRVGVRNKGKKEAGGKGGSKEEVRRNEVKGNRGIGWKGQTFSLGG